MGVGYPDEIEEYAKMGVDMMDCVLPTRAGRHGLVFAREVGGGAMNIKRKEYAEDQGPIDAACGCMVCRRYTRAYLRHLFASGEPLSGVLNSACITCIFIWRRWTGCGRIWLEFRLPPPPPVKMRQSLRNRDFRLGLGCFAGRFDLGLACGVRCLKWPFAMCRALWTGTWRAPKRAKKNDVSMAKFRVRPLGLDGPVRLRPSGRATVGQRGSRPEARCRIGRVRS